VLAERGSSSLDALYRKSCECFFALGKDVMDGTTADIDLVMLEPRSGAERPSLVVEKPGWLGVRGLAGGMAALG
jgi:hypothetical protein